MLGMMLHAWAGYERFAWGENELKPLSRTGNRGSILGSGSSGATIVDSLGRQENNVNVKYLTVTGWFFLCWSWYCCFNARQDTLYVMGLMAEYERGWRWVVENLTSSLTEANIEVSVFESWLTGIEFYAESEGEYLPVQTVTGIQHGDRGAPVPDQHEDGRRQELPLDTGGRQHPL